LILVLSAVTSPAAWAQDDKNCSDFSSADELQQYVDSHPGDPSNLDNDNDGYYCEAQFGTQVSASGGSSTGNLATTARSTENLELVALGVILLGLLLRLGVRRPAKHRISG